MRRANLEALHTSSFRNLGLLPIRHTDLIICDNGALPLKFALRIQTFKVFMQFQQGHVRFISQLGIEMHRSGRVLRVSG